MYNKLKKFYGMLHFDLNNSTSNTLLIAGSGRSGTTWLSEIINYRNEYRDIFEPFHPKVNNKINFEHKFIAEHNNSENIYKNVQKILQGKIRNYWTDKFNKKLIINKRLIKCIRANLFLKYVHRNFIEIPIIFIIRNPFAVVNSKMRLNKEKGWHFPQYFDEMIKNEDFYQMNFCALYN